MAINHLHSSSDVRHRCVGHTMSVGFLTLKVKIFHCQTQYDLWKIRVKILIIAQQFFFKPFVTMHYDHH
jgi:hypothetical protein